MALGAVVSGRRGLVTTVTALLVAGTVALVVPQATWMQVTARPGGLGSASVPTAARVLLAVKGTDLAGAVVPLAVLVVAGAVGLVATRGWFRRVVGVLVTAAGGGLAASGVRVLSDPSGAAAGFLAQQSLPADPATTYDLAAMWPAVTVVAGLLVVVAGLLAALASARWPAMGARYEAPAGSRRQPAADPWTALDRGEDPTVPE
jgi:uncharacterized membrane protein (TIGR02234 family)